MVPEEGAVGWTPSLRYALKVGLLEEDDATELRNECGDADCDVVPVREAVCVSVNQG